MSEQTWCSSEFLDRQIGELCFLRATKLDEGPRMDAEHAAFLYRRALLYQPTFIPAIVNLANIHYSRNNLPECLALYHRAVAIDGNCFEAHFNLGNIYLDLRCHVEAIEQYRAAVQLKPEYPEAQFYLAVSLERHGMHVEAIPHWNRFLALKPTGEFVELAKEFIGENATAPQQQGAATDPSRQDTEAGRGDGEATQDSTLETEVAPRIAGTGE